MIEIFKLKELKSNDLKQLAHVTPWWEKNINQILKKNKRWIEKFGINSNDFIPFEKIEQATYSKLFAASNNYLNFFKPKLKQFINDERLFKKFDQMLTDYMTLNGFCWGIQTVIDYYLFLETNDVENKRKCAIKLGNQVINKKYLRFKNEIYKTIIEHDVLDEIFSNEVHLDSQLFESKVIILTLAKFSAKLLKAKKISKEVHLRVTYLCYLQLGFNQAYNWLYYDLINRLY
ncbi:hypothetical protein CXP39_02205 [Mesoplasma syrphidae]|uniref:Uncharacterized protein n=1 Tax=Mesoplasma syrphidae TaxID=225999 RepID=A0A2K9CD72_9MOLU|nr:hypothetical protein [Mesoplasma syrphidae]AUF83604.1 hypothetical protein CXP39_02205 [Mesoplasma syrphidae]